MIEASGCAKNTMVIVTYDEFGGQWDHVSPPGQGERQRPARPVRAGHAHAGADLRAAPEEGFAVDSTEHDTTSILATIEHRYGLAPLATRDAAVSDLSSVWSADRKGHNGDNGDDDGHGHDSDGHGHGDDHGGHDK